MTLVKYWFRIHTDNGSAFAIAEDYISSFMLYLRCLDDETGFSEYYFDDHLSMSGFICEMNESSMVIIPGHWLDINCKFIVLVRNNERVNCESAND